MLKTENLLKLRCILPDKELKNHELCLKKMTHKGPIARKQNQSLPKTHKRTLTQALEEHMICWVTAEALLVKAIKNWIKVMLKVRVGVLWKLLSRTSNNHRLLMIEGNQQIYVTSVALVIKSQVTLLKDRHKRLPTKQSSIETKTNSNLTHQRRILNHETNLLLFSRVTQNIAILWIAQLSRKTKGLLQCQSAS